MHPGPGGDLGQRQALPLQFDHGTMGRRAERRICSQRSCGLDDLAGLGHVPGRSAVQAVADELALRRQGGPVLPEAIGQEVCASLIRKARRWSTSRNRQSACAGGSSGRPRPTARCLRSRTWSGTAATSAGGSPCQEGPRRSGPSRPRRRRRRPTLPATSSSSCVVHRLVPTLGLPWTPSSAAPDQPLLSACDRQGDGRGRLRGPGPSDHPRPPRRGPRPSLPPHPGMTLGHSGRGRIEAEGPGQGLDPGDGLLGGRPSGAGSQLTE